jgi:hypothetical protein
MHFTLPTRTSSDQCTLRTAATLVAPQFLFFPTCFFFNHALTVCSSFLPQPFCSTLRSWRRSLLTQTGQDNTWAGQHLEHGWGLPAFSELVPLGAPLPFVRTRAPPPNTFFDTRQLNFIYARARKRQNGTSTLVPPPARCAFARGRRRPHDTTLAHFLPLLKRDHIPLRYHHSHLYTVMY